MALVYLGLLGITLLKQRWSKSLKEIAAKNNMKIRLTTMQESVQKTQL